MYVTRYVPVYNHLFDTYDIDSLTGNLTGSLLPPIDLDDAFSFKEGCPRAKLHSYR